MRFSLLALVSVALAQQDLVSLLQSQSDLSTLLEAVTIVPGLADTLSSSENITILAPTNAAFEKIDPESQEGLALANKLVNATSTLLAYHVLKGSYLSTDLGEVPTYVQTLLDSSYVVTDTVRCNVTGGQNVGLVNFGNGTVSAISSELLTSNVVEAVSNHVIPLSARWPDQQSRTSQSAASQSTKSIPSSSSH